jgi:anti-sigma factor RsiW
MSDASGDEMPACDRMEREILAAWVDGALPTAEAREEVAAHVAACSSCAVHEAGLRAQKRRLAGFRATTTTATLPAGFWEGVRNGLDRIDAERRPTSGAPRRVEPHRRCRSLWLAAAVAAAIAALALSAAWRLRPRPVVPVAALARLPLDGALPAGSVAVATNDADRAARWLSDQLGTEIPTVNLSLAGARVVGARAERASGRGMLLYRGARDVPIALYLYTDPRAMLPPLRAVAYNGSTYSILENAAPRATVAAWEADGRTFVASAPLPLADLLPYAREMDRHCRRRP